VLRQRAERRHRQKQQRPDDQNCAEQQEAEGHRIVAHRPERDRRDLLAAQVEAIASGRDDRQVARENSITRPVPMSNGTASGGGLALLFGP